MMQDKQKVKKEKKDKFCIKYTYLLALGTSSVLILDRAEKAI